MIFNDNFYIEQNVHKTYRFYLDFIFFIISSLIFLVVVILSIICKFVIYFFKLFLFVLSFRVEITFESSFIVSRSCWFSYQFSFFLSKAIYPCFFFIYSTFIAFCSSISIIALLSWILSLKFSKICSFMLFIYYFSSIRPQIHEPLFCWGWRGGLAILLSIFGSLSFSMDSSMPLSVSLSFNSSISFLKSFMMFLYSLMCRATNFLLVSALVLMFLALPYLL